MQFGHGYNRYQRKVLRKRHNLVSVEDKGVYIYENNTAGELMLPKPSLDGKRRIGAKQQFKGDGYFMQLVRSGMLRLIKVLVDGRGNKIETHDTHDVKINKKEVDILKSEGIVSDKEVLEGGLDTSPESIYESIKNLAENSDSHVHTNVQEAVQEVEKEVAEHNVTLAEEVDVEVDFGEEFQLDEFPLEEKKSSSKSATANKSKTAKQKKKTRSKRTKNKTETILNEATDMSEEKLILDQPDIITEEGKVEYVVKKDAQQLNEESAPQEQKEVLLNEGPVEDGFLIVEQDEE